MNFIELKNIVRKDSPIHYINEYHGVLVYSDIKDTKECKIEIILEKNALGMLSVYIHFTDAKEAALIDCKNELEQYILTKHKEGFFSE